MSFLSIFSSSRILAEHDVSSIVFPNGRKVYIKIPKKLTFFHGYNVSYHHVARTNHSYLHRCLSTYCIIPCTKIFPQKKNSYRLVQDAVHDARPVTYTDLQDPLLYTQIENILTQGVYMRDRDGCFPDLCGSDALYDFALHNILINDAKQLFFIDTVGILKKDKGHPLFCLLSRLFVPIQIAMVRHHLFLGKCMYTMKHIFSL